MADTGWPELLEQACRRGRITPVFQPIVDLARGVVCGYEGLARFERLAPEMPAPQPWFAAASWHGFSGRLEAAALSAMLRRRRDLPSNTFLSVNLSPDAVLAPEVQEMLSSATDLSGLVLEITEQTPVTDYGALTRALAGLRDGGAMVAVDDTGAGYASLSHLLALRPEFVKLDRGLVSGLDLDPQRAAAVSAIGAFASQLDAWLVAEGIENERELGRLIDLGVPLAQGFLLGRPERQMRPLPALLADQVRTRHGLPSVDRLSALARPAPVMREAPQLIAEATILADDNGRPRRVLVPAGGRRSHRYAAMCVAPGEEVRDVALRAAARQSEDRYGPLCLCDEAGAPLGLIMIESLLEALARDRPHP